jgi:hypothetical protein
VPLSRSLIWVVPGVAFVAILGCSNDPDPWVAPPRDGGASDAAGKDALCSTPVCVVSGECNDVVNDGPMVVPQFVEGLAPAPTGGPIADGKYWLTAYTIFISSDGGAIPLPEWARAAVRITGADFDSVSSYRSEGFTQKDAHDSYAISTSGTSLTLHARCPVGPSNSVPYSASATELKLYYLAFVGITGEETFTKQ